MTSDQATVKRLQKRASLLWAIVMPLYASLFQVACMYAKDGGSEMFAELNALEETLEHAEKSYFATEAELAPHLPDAVAEKRSRIVQGVVKQRTQWAKNSERHARKEAARHHKLAARARLAGHDDMAAEKFGRKNRFEEIARRAVAWSRRGGPGHGPG